jgi:hypothetical protein
MRRRAGICRRTSHGAPAPANAAAQVDPDRIERASGHAIDAGTGRVEIAIDTFGDLEERTFDCAYAIAAGSRPGRVQGIEVAQIRSKTGTCS